MNPLLKKQITLLTLLVLSSSLAYSQEKPKLTQQQKWEQKIKRYEALDAANPPGKDIILFVGSSTVENWKSLATDFPGVPVVNRGVSGTKTIDLFNYRERLISPYQPKQIFIYEGDNDIGYKWAPERILAQFKELFFAIREEKPEAEIIFISIKPSPRRLKDKENIEKANALIKEFISEQTKAGYADVYNAMLTDEGELYPEHYLEDGLHLSKEGYKVWKEVISLWLTGTSQTYKDKTASVEDRVNDLLPRLTLEEKIDYIGGYKGFYIRGVERLGIPEIKLTDGPVGTHKDGKSTAYPAGTLSAATWNKDLVYELGKQLGRDSRARGVHILLAPGMNIIRSPLCGRNFEYFTEDPYLNAQTTIAYVKGLQDQRVVATLKHYAANNQEWDRNNVSSDIDERVLHEIYLSAYKAAIKEAGAGAVMDSYNPINGVRATEHDYLNNQILKKQWGFDGIVMSDWSATYDAVAAANGGLDLEMPRAKWMNKEKLIPAIREGKVTEATIDDKVRRILRLIFKFGFFDNEQLDSSIPYDNPEAAKVALNLAREGIVLLKNENNLLPLNPSKVKSIAVIGPNANSYISGGGSSYTFPFHYTSVLQGLKESGHNLDIAYAPGVPTLPETVSNSLFYTAPGSQVKGLKAEYYDNIRLKGEPVQTVIDSIVNIGYGWHIASENKGIPYDHCSMRWSGVIRPDKTTNYRFVVRGFDGFRLKVADEQVINEWRDQGITTREVVLPLKAGTEYPIVLEYFANVHPVDISFGWREDKLLFDAAIDIAKKADVAIVNIGFNESSERESNDRPFELPEYQDSLVQCITKANPHTIVLLNAGGNVDMTKWIDRIPSLLHIWYTGQEGGTAIAEILFGKVNPSGKLPISFERKWEDNPAYPYYYDTDNDKRVLYSEGLFMGYRHYDVSPTKPLFPFGYGLSYTQFEYANLKVTKVKGSNEPAYKVTFSIKNTGNYDGAEAAQVYIRPIDPKVTRPYKELKGFAKHFIKKNATQKVEVVLNKEAFSYYKTEKKDFDYDAGNYEVLVGSASDKIWLRKVIRVD